MSLKMFGTVTIKLVLVLVVLVLLYFLINRWINNSLDANSPTLDVAKAVGLQDYVTTKDNIVTACTTERERRAFDHQRSLVNRELLKNLSFRAKLRVSGQENGGPLGILRAVSKPKNQRVDPLPILVEDLAPDKKRKNNSQQQQIEMERRAKKLRAITLDDDDGDQDEEDQGFVDRGSSSCSGGETRLARYYDSDEALASGDEEDVTIIEDEDDEDMTEDIRQHKPLCASSTYRREIKMKRPKLGARIRRRHRRRSRKSFHPLSGQRVGTAGSHIYHHYYYRTDRPDKLRRRDECTDFTHPNLVGPALHQPMQRHTLPPPSYPPPAITAPDEPVEQDYTTFLATSTTTTSGGGHLGVGPQETLLHSSAATKSVASAIDTSRHGDALLHYSNPSSPPPPPPHLSQDVHLGTIPV